METCPTCNRPIVAKRKRCYYCTGRKRTGDWTPCAQCGKPRYVQPNQAKRGEGRYCSPRCQYMNQPGRPNKVGNRFLTSSGYVAVIVAPSKQQLEHRLVVEAALGRPLRSDEEVHHRNGDKLDNRLENLEVLSPSAHQTRHADRLMSRRSRVSLTCRRCGVTYERKTSKAASAFCSNACRLVALHEGNRKHPTSEAPAG